MCLPSPRTHVKFLVSSSPIESVVLICTKGIDSFSVFATSKPHRLTSLVDRNGGGVAETVIQHQSAALDLLLGVCELVRLPSGVPPARLAPVSGRLERHGPFRVNGCAGWNFSGPEMQRVRLALCVLQSAVRGPEVRLVEVRTVRAFRLFLFLPFCDSGTRQVPHIRVEFEQKTPCGSHGKKHH